MKNNLLKLAMLVFCTVLLVSIGFADKGKKTPSPVDSATEDEVKEPAKKVQPASEAPGTTQLKIPEKKVQPAPGIQPAEPQPTQIQPSPQIKPAESKQTQIQPAPAAGDKGRQIKWQVFSGTGGVASESKGHRMTYTVGQGAIGYTGSDSYQAVQGFQTGVIGGGGTYNCGDANNDGTINVGDIVYLVSYCYLGGPAPIPITCVGDVNNDNTVNVGDIVYLVSYCYLGGPGPNPFCCE